MDPYLGEVMGQLQLVQWIKLPQGNPLLSPLLTLSHTKWQALGQLPKDTLLKPCWVTITSLQWLLHSILILPNHGRLEWYK